MTRAGLLDLLAEGSHPGSRARFRADPEAPPIPLEEVWSDSERATGWVRARRGDEAVIAMVLEASAACIATLVGAWRAGARVVSLPERARTQSVASHRAQVEAACRDAGTHLLLSGDPKQPSFEELKVDLATFEEAVTGDRRPEATGGGQLVQFSSGTTGSPKGVILGTDALAANVSSILDRLALPGPGRSCSWLPLSHDMGLVGMCLVPWAAFGPRWQENGEMVLLPTNAFARNPTIWMRACSSFKATVTTAPSFAYDLVARRLVPGRALDLSSLRACIIGAEPIRHDTLRRFTEAGAPHGLRPDAICPAYGMAEAALAVSLHPPGHPWRTTEVDGRSLVDCGPPVASTEVRTGVSGTLSLRGPSLFDGYLGEQPRSDEWFATRDLAHLVDGHVHIEGRVDDLVFVGGTKLSALDLEIVAGSVPGARSESVAVLQAGPSGYVAVVERRTGASARAGAAEVARAVRAELQAAFGRGPAEVVVVAPGTLSRTPSGKIQRHLVREAIEAGSLEPDARMVFSAAQAVKTDS